MRFQRTMLRSYLALLSKRSFLLKNSIPQHKSHYHTTRDEMEGSIPAITDGGKWIINKEPDSGLLRLVFPKTPANR